MLELLNTSHRLAIDWSYRSNSVSRSEFASSSVQFTINNQAVMLGRLEGP